MDTAAPAGQVVDVFGAKARIYPVPPGTLVEHFPGDPRQWTDVQGAMVLAAKSRRTIQQWMANGWVVVRRTPAGRPRILVASLYGDGAEVARG